MLAKINSKRNYVTFCVHKLYYTHKKEASKFTKANYINSVNLWPFYLFFRYYFKMMQINKFHVFTLITLIVCSVAPPVVDVPQTGNWGKFWLFRLMVNLFCYASIAVPAYFAIRTLKKSAYLQNGLKIM